MQTQTTPTENFITKNKKTLLIIGALIVLSKLFGGGGDEYAAGNNGGAESSYTSASSSSSSSSQGSIDPQVVGRWMKEKFSTSTGSADYASCTAVQYFQFNQDGTYAVTDGGSTLAQATGEVLESGTWNVQDGALCMFFSNGTCREYYQFSDGKLVLGRGSNHLFLSPAN